jgi:hypothetical protein
MAAETIALTTDKDLTRSGKEFGVQYKEVLVDLAQVLLESDGTFEAGDVFQVLAFPADTVIWGGGLEVLTAVSGASAATFDWDIGAGDDFADGVDGTATGYGAVGTNGVLGFTNAVRLASADTVDLTLKTLTGTLTGGLIRCYVFYSDISGIESNP